MKYFTRAWASGDLSDDETHRIRDAYWRSIETAQERWPTPLTILARTNLHDSRPESAIINNANNSVVLTVLVGDLSTGYFRLTITYRDVDIDSLDLIVFRDRICDHCSEILYDEIESIDEGRFTHRILFYPVGELSIIFSDICINRAPMETRMRRVEMTPYTEIPK